MFLFQLSCCIHPMEAMAALFASMMHDLDHPGVNQAYLIATTNILASLYDVSFFGFFSPSSFICIKLSPFFIFILLSYRGLYYPGFQKLRVPCPFKIKTQYEQKDNTNTHTHTHTYIYGYDIKLHLMMRFLFWSLENEEYSFIAITSRFIQTQSGSTLLGSHLWDK